MKTDEENPDTQHNMWIQIHNYAKDYTPGTMGALVEAVARDFGSWIVFWRGWCDKDSRGRYDLIAMHNHSCMSWTTTMLESDIEKLRHYCRGFMAARYTGERRW